MKNYFIIFLSRNREDALSPVNSENHLECLSELLGFGNV